MKRYRFRGARRGSLIEEGAEIGGSIKNSTHLGWIRQKPRTSLTSILKVRVNWGRATMALAAAAYSGPVQFAVA